MTSQSAKGLSAAEIQRFLSFPVLKGAAMTILWLHVIQTATGPQALATTTDPRACQIIADAILTLYQIAGVCVRVVPGVAS